MNKCVVYAPRDHRLFDDAIRQIEHVLDVLLVVDQDTGVTEQEVEGYDFDLLISFLNRIIFRNGLLDGPNVNFHPAPPEYPGRGGASYALFDGAETYGATAHKMVGTVDTGEIYQVRNFPILPGEGCEHLYARSEEVCLDLLEKILHHIRKNGVLPPPAPIKWKRKTITTKEFEAWLTLDPDDKETFIKKIMAAKHSRYAGPYIELHGYRFALADDPD